MLEKLTQLWGVSGYEEAISDFLAQELRGCADSIKRDAIGNLIAFKKGSGKDKKRIMVASHMDEIGISVVKITDEGMLKFRSLGGVSPYIAYMNRVQFRNGTVGTVAAADKLDTIKPGELEKLYLDIGAKDKSQAEQLVRVGDPAMFQGSYQRLAGSNVMAKAFDDRVACAISAQAMQRMGTPYHDVYFVFTVQEEVGLRGATVSAEAVRPDLGIAVDITGSFDVPGDLHGNAVLGKGAAIKVVDGSVICDQAMTKALVDCAEKNKIAYQLDVLTNGGTDAGAINRAGSGVKAVGISVATRYGHSPNSIINLDDVEACTALLVQYTESPLDIVTEEILL